MSSMQQQPTPSSHHSLAFQVLRLYRPSFQAEDTILCVDPFDLFAGEDLFEDLAISPSLLDRATSRGIAAGGGTSGGVGAGSVVSGDFSYRNRFQLQNPIDALALSGLLMVSQSFGSIYLGGDVL